MSFQTSVAPAQDVKQYATSGFTAKDLIAEGGAPCRRLTPLADGTITIKVVKASTSRTIDVVANVAEDVEAVELTATDVDVKVYW